MAAVIDEALAQWDALAQREVADGYQVKESSSSAAPPSASDSHPGLNLHRSLQNNNAGGCCPSAWREKIVEWCYQVVDHCQLGRDVVSYAMSYFDRIVPKYGINDTLVQLVAMTCLYLAIKVHCTKKISVGAMCSLSRGSFRYDQVVKMERLVLQGLNWYLSPATPHLFLEVFFTAAAASSQGMNDDTTILNEVKETAQYLLELSVCDNFFKDKLPSSIARAAITAAMDIVARPIHVNIQLEDLLLDNDPVMIDKCSLRLCQIYNMVAKQENNGGSDAADVPQEILASSSMRQISPTSVFCHISTE